MISGVQRMGRGAWTSRRLGTAARGQANRNEAFDTPHPCISFGLFPGRFSFALAVAGRGQGREGLDVHS